MLNLAAGAVPPLYAEMETCGFPSMWPTPAPTPA
eukprot:CAMPEP_0182900602 /NCGR_PEP_ID=MMETSP0034_2-20130328/28975_1 /TAXON_ID=156128 /ORGANISM="Nephroselmis pyriformis, Strain CCMP717" /LENGTH=33 /DNA_ID= /DNA_START= /DNA_END= /DNA_ORIENTATION=